MAERNRLAWIMLQTISDKTIIFCFLKGGSFVEHSLMTPCITVRILGTVKVCFLYKNSDVLLEIIDKLSEIHPKFNNEVEIANEDRKTTNEEKVTKDSMRLLNLNMLVLIGSGVCVVTMFCLMPFILMMIGYYQDGVLKIQYPYLKGGSFVEHSLMTPCITVRILGTVKVCFLYKNSDVLLEIIDKLSEIHPKFNNEVEIANEDRKTTNEEKVTKDSMRLLNLNMLVLIGSGVCVVTMFCLMPFILMMIGYYQDGVLKIQYPYLVKYFFDAYSIRLWYLEYIHQVYATGIVFANVVGTDTLLLAFCTFIEMHFKLLSFRIENLRATSSEETKRNFVTSVIRHQELIHMLVLLSKRLKFFDGHHVLADVRPVTKVNDSDYK
ncbi:hypothetical protein O3G_MSEX002870 [Manduca sexta]|nr:hypothetical protein O3G_MSEX002870 [Manduca sexta]